MKKAREAYRSTRVVLLKAADEGDKPKAFGLLLNELTTQQADMFKAMEDATAVQEKIVKEVADKAASAASTASMLLAIGVFVMIVLGIWTAYSVIRALVGPMEHALHIASKIAEGDLTQRVQVDRNDEVGKVLTAMSSMQDSLIQVVSKVRTSSDSVANASAEIASGNQDLSSRTESQASALEETAASMEELGSTVRQNADSSSQANQLAQNASNVATQGGQVVSQVVQTMRDIHTSSQKIADIIGVIDGIAFQTNILALNAAVEAARAGEQGRGFAVVASEVRALAGRSAEAAKEIKTLISTSVEKVEQGSTQVDQAGQIMQEVVSSIRRVTDIVGEISAASAEQSAGVSQVGEAIGSIDQTTQQNAALVEEMAAAAASLKSQANELVQAVGVFKLNGQESVRSSYASSAGAGGAVAHKPVSTASAYKPTAKSAVSKPTAMAKPAAASMPKAAAKAPVAPASPAKSLPMATAKAADDEWESF
ncbi:methyl-accepting chemotaxis protein [Curvibacter sp. CHRR-16]|uniref:methyl-accepting chemotaxis protein n=1 Tax=Curvibacter sp. CHRR-16 TaxID=2835872 RepID=UPI0032E9D55E